MKKVILAALITIALTIPAFAGTYTITTTDEQEAGLTWAREQNRETLPIDIERDKNGNPLLTTTTPKYPDNQAYFVGIASAALDGYMAQKKAADLPKYVPMKDAYEKLSPDDQARVNAILGVGK
jgi:hypothetical protein